MIKYYQSFPIRSWVGLPRVCDPSPWIQFYFRNCRNYFLSCSTPLVELYLYGIPHSAYISPQAIAGLLSILSSLQTLSLEFRSPQSCPDRENSKSASTETLYPPRSRQISFQRRYRIFRGTRDPHRSPSTQPNGYIFLQSN